MNYGYTMIDDRHAVCPIACDPGWSPCGVDANTAHLMSGGMEKRIELPFWQGGACFVETASICCGDDYLDVHMLIPHPRGTLICNVTLDEVQGQVFAIAEVGPPDEIR